MGELWTRFGEPRHTVWKSANGTAWNSFLPPEMPPYLHSLATFGGRYLAIGDDEQGPAVFSSADALVWTAALEAGESPNGFTWFNSLSTGDLGVLVVAESEGDHFGGAIGYVVLEDEVELAVEGGFVTVVALESSQILLEGSFDELVEQGLAENVGGVVRFYDEEASLLIEVRLDEISEALIPPDDGGGVEFEVRSTLYFSADGENFNVLVQPDELSGIYIHQTLVGSDYVVLAGEEMLMMEEMAGGDEEASATTQVAAAAPATIGHTAVFPGGDFIPQLVVVVGIPAS